jgi:ankyrin repeat protein
LGQTGREYSAKDFFPDGKVAQLAEAARDGDVARVKLLVSNGTKPNARGYDGITPLIYAMSGKTLKGFRRLLELGADPNLRMTGGKSVMAIAANRVDSPEALKLAIAFGGDPNLRTGVRAVYGDCSPTPIFDAVNSRKLENLRILIKAGANLEARNSFDHTPLLDAACICYYDVVLFLLEAGADFHAKSESGETVGYYMLASRPRGPSAEAKEPWHQCMDFLRKRGVSFAEEKARVEAMESGLAPQSRIPGNRSRPGEQ